MIVTVVQKAGNKGPTSFDPGKTIWEGGYQGDVRSGEDTLPASIAAGMLPDFEVGKWYSWGHFTAMLASVDISGETWTEIGVPTLSPDPDDGESTPLTVRQAVVVSLILEAVTEMVTHSNMKEGLWIRVQ